MKTFRPYTVPARAHPFVRRLVEEMNAQEVKVDDLCHKAGIAPMTYFRWRRSNAPNLANITACLNVLGLEVVVRPKEPQI